MFPAPDTLLQIAQVQKSYGTEGEVIINFSAEAYDYFDEKRPVFLFFDGLPVPFFVESFETKGTRKALVRLTDINTMSRAEEIVGQKIYIDPKDYSELSQETELTEENLTIEDLAGFRLFDQNDNLVGVITYIHDFSGNICFEIENLDSYIPYHDELLIDIDIESKEIILEISEGLL
jgi:16S rRNA processing protein RimM